MYACGAVHAEPADHPGAVVSRRVVSLEDNLVGVGVVFVIIKQDQVSEDGNREERCWKDGLLDGPATVEVASTRLCIISVLSNFC